LFGDGSHVRDVFDADDAADAILMAISDQIYPTATWNIGSGQGLSNMEVLSMVERVTRRKVPLDRRPARDADVPYIVLDTTLVRNNLGWATSRDLEGTIKEIWHRNFAPAAQFLG
ncbi:hypothetical protein ACQKGA_30080, partial [Priestia megaterium]|uniref:hypothetical protein n=1 Tax=Priestia megaterium TaxID=1404 RepID=UPI003D04B0AD